MANYIVSDTNLTAVANAIRQKGGTSASLEFPDDFVEAIGDIQTGGGSSVTVEALNVTQNGTYTAPSGTAYSPVTVSVSGSGTDTLAALEANTLTSWTSTATTVALYLFQNKTALTSVSYPNATEIKNSAFNGCTSLVSASFPEVTTIGSSAFLTCSSLTAVNAPKVTIINGTGFKDCTSLVEVEFPVLTNLPYADTFRGCTKLEFADLGLCTCIANNTFYGDTKFKTLILRSSTVATLNNTNAFNSSPFSSGMSGGTVYVPEALISNYQSASNWSTIFGRPNNQIKKIEGSIYE